MSNGVISGGPGVDAFRFLLMIPVILAHAWFFAGPDAFTWTTALPLVACHAAVPFFFLVSGSLVRWQEGDLFAVPRWLLRKLLPLFVVWISIYIAVAWLIGRDSLADLVGTIDQGGPTRHLWFLPALGMALSLVTLSLRLAGWRATWVMAVVLAVVGLIQGGYQLFLGYPNHWLRCAFLTAPLFVLIGAALAQRPLPSRPLLFGAALLASYLLQLGEDMLIASAPGYAVQRHPTVTVATFPYAVSLFLFARSLPVGEVIRWLAGFRSYAVTIYCLHPLFLMVLEEVLTARCIGLAYGLTAVVLLLCIGCAKLGRELVRWAGRQRAGELVATRQS